MAICGRKECVYEAVEKMIKKMKEKISVETGMKEDEIVIAKIYQINANILAEACRKSFKIKNNLCKSLVKERKKNLTLETFILLKELEEEKLISHEYKEKLFNALIKMKPSIKASVEESKKTGMV